MFSPPVPAHLLLFRILNSTLISTNSPFYQAHCIHCRLPDSFCPCAKLKKTTLPFEIVLLTHSSEWQKNHNTGQWFTISADKVQRLIWSRKMPAADIQPGDFLMFPGEQAVEITNQSSGVATPITRLWLFDGTWQQAHKMLRQSPWLQAMPQLKLENIESQFNLRRNQRGLCTMESAITALSCAQPEFDDQHLWANFHQLQQAYQSISSSC